VAICDVNTDAVTRVLGEHPGVEVTAGRDDLLARPLDIYAPCALGGALNDDSVARLSAKIVCGGANNQLAHPGIEKMLADRGILYAPDYLVNAGGVIQVADELAGFNFERAKARADQIFGTTRKIFALADEEGVPPAVAADRVAERRMAEVGRLRGIWLGP
jgi:valine dehydrogenase (NAD+)